MKKRNKIALLQIFIFAIALNAQVINLSRELVNLNQVLYPSRSYVPNEIKIFLSDSTEQIFLNPSKANSYEKEFFVWSRIMGLSALKVINDQKYFYNFNLSNRLYENEYLNEDNSFRNNILDKYKYENNLESLGYRSDNTFNGRIVWVGQKGHSFGIFGGIKNLKIENNTKSFSERERWTHYSYVDSNYTLINQNGFSKNKISTFGLGFEHNFAEKDFEFTSNIFWQTNKPKGSASSFSRVQENELRIDSENIKTVTKSDFTQIDEQNSFSNRANYFTLNLFIKNKLNLFKNDFGIIKFSGFLQKNEKYRTTTKTEIFDFESINDSISFDLNEEVLVDDGGEREIFSTYLQLGYFLPLQRENVTYVFGFTSNTYFDRTKTTYQYSNNNYYFRNLNREFITRTRINFYETNRLTEQFINYFFFELAPKKWFSAYFGLTNQFSYSYQIYESKNEEFEFDARSGEVIENHERVRDENVHNFSTKNSIYSGFQLIHKSGLRFDVSFYLNPISSRSILNYDKNWLFKVSYHY